MATQMPFGRSVTSTQIPVIRAIHMAKPNMHGAGNYPLPTLVGGNAAPCSKGMNVRSETMI